MAHYRVVVQGTGFVSRIEDRQRQLGFYGTFFVEAEDEPSARRAALALAEARTLPRHEGSERPSFEADTAESCDSVPEVQPGLAWFPEDDGSEA